uniref:Free fatty acid receptor 3-like n=2 Tax=Lepisosteus oculatus TaxID=7918 RepID=W5NMC0_LEPOC
MANYPVLAVYIVTFLTGLPCNLLALAAFIVKVRRKPLPTDILLLNLTVSDLIFLFFLPFKISEAFYGHWVLPRLLCSVSSFVFFSTIYITTLILTAVSVDRYLGVAFPIMYKYKRQPVHAIVVSVIFWVFSSAHCSIVYITELLYPRDTTMEPVCYDNFTDKQLAVLLPVRLELCIVLFLIPLIISTFCYLNFIRILNTLPNISPQKKLRAIGMALGTLLIFILCFLPYNISHIVGYVNQKSPEWRTTVLLLSTFNACLDPIIFFFSSSSFQETSKEICFKILGKKYMPQTNL